MPKVSREHQESRRNQIIRAALKCFSQKGFHQTSMQDIVAESGLSPGAIYLYFRSKDEIIRTTADIRHQNEKELFSEIFAEDSANHALSQVADLFFNSLRNKDILKERNMEVQLWGEAMVNPAIFKVVSEGFLETKRVFTGIIKKYQEQGKLDPRHSPEAIAGVMLAQFQGFVLQMQIDDELDVNAFHKVVQSLIDSYFDNGMGAGNYEKGKHKP